MYRATSPVVPLTAVLLSTGLTWLTPAASVRAQTADSESAGLSEVVVTAPRREGRLQDVPISVSAFGQDKID